jgi:hypothetical protein
VKLRTHLNLIVAGLSAVLIGTLVYLQIDNARRSVREEIAAANVVASQLLGRIAWVYTNAGAEALRHFLNQLGRVRANEITLRAANGEVLYRSPPSTYKAGREAPEWFARLLMPPTRPQSFALADGAQLILEANPSRAILDGWDDLLRLLAAGGIALALLTCDRARGVVELWLERVDRVSPERRASWKVEDCDAAQGGSVLAWVRPTRLVVMMPVMRASEGPEELLVQSFAVDGAAERELARHRVRGAERAIVPVEVASDGVTLVYRLRVEGDGTEDRVVALDLDEGSPLVLAEGEPASGLCLGRAERGVVAHLGRTVAWYGWNGRVRSLVDAAQVVACLPDGRVLVLVEEGGAVRLVLVDSSA